MLRETRHGEFAPASRLCKELTERGGLCASFATFLRWRGDLLPRASLLLFRQAREAAPASRSDAAALLRQELGGRGDELAAHLDAEPCWSTRARWAFRSQFEGRRVVVESEREPVSESEFRAFEREVSRWREPSIPRRRQSPPAPPGRVVSSDTFKQFHEWLGLTDGLARERAYLEAADEFREHTSFLFPEVISELCSARVLCFTWIEGNPVSSRIQAGDVNVAGQLAELILEQPAVLGMIDADLDLEDIVLTGSGRLALRRWNRFVPVPLGLRPAVLRYVCGVMSGESSRAARMLVRLALSHHSDAAAEGIRKSMASFEPELKGELRFPISATMFESYWRAASNISRGLPLYLDCLHRNLHAVGYYCAEAASEATGGDPMAEAQFAVLGRLIRRRGADLLETESASSWALGLAMLPLNALRHAVRFAERFVENEHESGFHQSTDTQESGAQDRRICSVVLAGLLTAIFLVCAHVGRNAPAPWAAWLAAGAAAAFVGVIGVVVRLG